MTNNQDYCLRATSKCQNIRAFVAASRNLADTAAKIHQTTPVASAALGRLLTAAAIMGLMTGNDEDSLTISIKGDGVLGGVLAVSDGLGRVRGYVHYPQADVPLKQDGKLDVGAAIGEGQLSIAVDIGLKEPYVGKVDLISGEIAEDLAHYFAVSEQTPSVVSLGVLVDKDHSVKQAGGVFVQLLPGFSDEVIDNLEKHIADFPPLSKLLDEGKTPEDIMDMLLAPFGYDITQKSPIEFYCNCDKQRVERALVSLGKDELTQILNQQGKAEITCHFCNTAYNFDANDLSVILSEAKNLAL